MLLLHCFCFLEFMQSLLRAAGVSLVLQYGCEWVKVGAELPHTHLGPSTFLNSKKLRTDSVQRIWKISKGRRELGDEWAISSHGEGGGEGRLSESFLMVMFSAWSFLSTVTKIYSDTKPITQSTPVSFFSFCIFPSLSQPSVLCHVEWATSRDDCAVIFCSGVCVCVELGAQQEVSICTEKETTDPWICTLVAAYSYFTLDLR